MRVNSIGNNAFNAKLSNNDSGKTVPNFKGSSMGACAVTKVGTTLATGASTSILGPIIAIGAAIAGLIFHAHAQDVEMRSWSEKESEEFIDHLIETDCWFG